MNLYKKIILQNPVQEDILKLITPPEIPNHKIGFVGKLDLSIQESIFKILDIKKESYHSHNKLLVYFMPNSSIVIHSDTRKDSLYIHQVNQTVLLPLINCEKLKWSWYDLVNKDAVFYYGEEKKFNVVPSIPLQDTKVLYEKYCDAPFISNVKQWHNLTNTGNEIAIAISIRLLPWSGKTDFSLPPIPNVIYE